MPRHIELLLTTTLIILFTPLLVAIAIIIVIIDGRPVLFRQARAGQYGKPFLILKFRTMRATPPTTPALPDSQRITSLGRILRATSLDELPELINVLRGDMALVGPRPLPTEYLRRYTTNEMSRHNVRPGMTGWSQVHGRNNITWEERLAQDIWYVHHRTPRLDMQILLLTIPLVISRRGIASPGQATMSEFRPSYSHPPDRDNQE